MELVRNAWAGWQDYISHGKLAALFLAAVIYLLQRRGGQKETRQAAGYGIITAALCICPLTAAFLMRYQTRFYDYVWVWSLVPVTLIIALGGTCFLFDWGKKNPGIKNVCYNAFLAGMLIVILVLCGRLGEEPYERRKEAWESAEAQRILSEIEKYRSGRELCLWAPREISEYIRALDGSIKLPYGRNMWDISLNAYSYDNYAAEVRELYLWMEGIAQDGEWIQKCEQDGKRVTDVKEEGAERMLIGEEQLKSACQLGVNCILLKDNFTDETAVELGNFVAVNHLEEIQLGGYYLLMTR